MRKIINDISDYDEVIDYLLPCLGIGDCLLLSGDLGVGKTTFVRLLVRRLCGDSELSVLSPSFSLVQSYCGVGGVMIYHYDLYRLGGDSGVDSGDDSGGDDLVELGFEESLSRGIVLVEWSERLGIYRPGSYYSIDLVELFGGVRELSLSRVVI